MLNASGAIVGSSEKKQLIATMSRSAALVGLYPATSKLPTWKVAECCLRWGWATLSGADDPWPDWVLDAADVMPLADAVAAVHQPRSLAEAHAGTPALALRRGVRDSAHDGLPACGRQRHAHRDSPPSQRRRVARRL